MFFFKPDLTRIYTDKSIADDRDSPASRAYPKVLDINSPTGTPTNKKVDTDGPGGKDKDSHRPWPKPYKHQNGSKRNRDTIKPMPLGLPGHKQDDAPLQRWLREPSAQGPYHGIADAVENPCQAHSTKDNNTKHHRS